MEFIYQKIMNNKDLLDKEIEILKEIPEEKHFDFIEKFWGQMRSILDQHDQDRIDEEIENLKKWYLWI